MGTSDGSKPGNASRVPVSSRPNVASCTRSSCSVPYENRRGIDPIHTLSRSLYSAFRRCREPRTAPAVSHGPHGSHGLKNLFCSAYSAPPCVARWPRATDGTDTRIQIFFCSVYSAPSVARSLAAKHPDPTITRGTFLLPCIPRLPWLDLCRKLRAARDHTQ